MKKYMQLWICSVVVFFVSFLYGVWFLFHQTIGNMLIVVLLMTLASALFVYCNKRITFPDGFNAFQALKFYRTCYAAGLNTMQKFLEEAEMRQQIVNKFEFSKKLSKAEIRHLYSEGKKIYYSMNKES